MIRILPLLLLLTACSHLPVTPNNPQEETTMHLSTPDGILAYDSTGTGPLILLLPGLGDLRQSYRFLQPGLAEQGYQVVSMDLRGHGDSSSHWPEYTTQATADDLLRLIQHLDAGPALVIGNSFSAGTAVWAATRAPEQISGVVMLGPFVRDQPLSLLQKTGLQLLLNGPWKVRAWVSYHRSLFTNHRPDDLPEYSQQLHQNLQQPGRFAAVRAMIQRSDAAVAERLPQLTQPVLILMGDQDPDFRDPEAEARWIAEQTGGRFAMIQNAGHYPQAEAPAATLQALMSFIQEEQPWPSAQD